MNSYLLIRCYYVSLFNVNLKKNIYAPQPRTINIDKFVYTKHRK